MERHVQAGVLSAPDVRAPTPISNGKQLLKEVWYGVGKAVESQSPAAWNERIIRLINTQIIPRLTPEQHQTLYRYKKPIEVAATGAGIGIATVELIAAVVAFRWGVGKLRSSYEAAALKRGLKKIGRYKAAEYVPVPVRWATHANSLLEPGFAEALHAAYADPLSPFERQMHALYREKFPRLAEQAVQFSMTMKHMAGAIAKKGGADPRWEATMHFALGGKKPEALVRIREQFMASFAEATRSIPAMASLSDDARQLLAGEAFRIWGDDLQFRGLEDLFFRSQKTARVDYAIAQKAAIRLGGHRMPITFDEILASYQSAATKGPAGFESVLGDHWWESGQPAGLDMKAHAEKMAEISKRIDKQIGLQRKDHKPDTHRFLDARGNIIRPGTTPQPLRFEQSVREAVDEKIRQFVARRDGKIQRIHDAADRTPRRLHETVGRVAVVRDLGTPEIRLRRALTAGFPKNEPASSSSHRLIESLLLQVQQTKTKPEVREILGLLSRPDTEVSRREKSKLASSLFAQVFAALPPDRQNTLRMHPDTLFATMGTKWVQGMHLAGLDVLTNRDIVEALAPKTHVSTKELLPVAVQVKEIIRAVKANMWRPEMLQAVDAVAHQGAWRQSDDGVERAGTKALYDLFHTAMEHVRPEQWEMFGPHDEITRGLIEDARRHGKGTTKFLAMELADWWAQHDAPGLGALYKRLRGNR